MSVLNHTPFAAIAFRQYNLAGELNGVLSVRGAFEIVPDGRLRLSQEQPALVPSDEYLGDPLTTPPLRQGDLVPFKPGTDVTLVGSTYAPGLCPARTWACALRVGPVAKRLVVHGPRAWQPRMAGTRRRPVMDWSLSEGDPVVAVPLDWTRAYGGPKPRPPDAEGPVDVDPANPLGLGIVDPAHSPRDRPIPAPQIEAPERPIRRWDEVYAPEGLAPLAPWWRPRQRHAGTYDDAWLSERHPLLPEDFDYRFWQCAHPDLIATPWLSGDEPFELVNLVPGAPGGLVRGWLPGLRLRLRLARGEGRYGVADLALDGVHVDLRPAVERVFLTWRATFPWADGRGQPELAVVRPLAVGAGA